MRRIYTCIDIGTDSIKAVTIEDYNEKCNVLASAKVKSKGVKQGLIVDASSVSQAIKKAVKQLESKLGTKVDKVIAVVPSNNMETTVTIGKTNINHLDNIITGDDIFSCLQNSLKDKVSKDMEVVCVSPIEYKINKNKKVKNPLGLEGQTLEVKAVITTVPKKNVYSVVSVLKNLNIEVMDIIISAIADYYATKTKELDERAVGLINIGVEKTNISIFNKGILVEENILPIGSANIDSDISFTYKTDLEESKKIKEEFAVSNRKYADSDESYDCTNRLGEKVSINQYKLSELIETRIIDLLQNAQNELNNLTNHEIGYIIITGGVTSMLGFNAIVEELFPRNAMVINIGILGIRDNVYSSAYGAIKYFIEKLNLREKEYTMFDEEKVNEILSTRKKVGSNGVLSKIFGKIFD